MSKYTARVCVSLHLHQEPLKTFTDFHETWYNRRATERNISDMTAIQKTDVGEKLKRVFVGIYIYIYMFVFIGAYVDVCTSHTHCGLGVIQPGWL
jgi:hypothetical protein